MSARPEALSVSIRMLWPFARAGRRCGVMLPRGADVQLTAEQLTDGGTRLPWPAAVRAVEALVAATRRPDLGLMAATLLRPEDLGALAQATAAQATLEAALALNDRYQRLLVDGVVIETVWQGDKATRNLRPTVGAWLPPAIADFALGTWLVIARHIVGDQGIHPSAVHLRRQSPANLTAYEELFRCPVHFSAPEDALEIARLDLERPSRFADAMEASLFEAHLERELARLPNLTLAQQARDQIAGRLSSGVPRVSDLARSLGLSPRNLTRKLAEENTTYREVVALVRSEAAVHRLTTSTLPGAEIASRVGFSSVHAFHRAFRAATGMTPAEARRRAGARAGPRKR